MADRRWMAGVAGLGLLALGLLLWGFSERSARLRAENATSSLQSQYDAQGLELLRAGREGQDTAGRLAKVQQDQRRLNDQLASDTLKHRAAADELLSEKAALMKELDTLALKLEQAEKLNRNLAEDLKKSLESGNALETAIATERARAMELRNAADADLRAVRADLEKARKDARQTSTALEQTQKDSQDLQKDLARVTADAQASEKESERLAGDLQRTLRDRDAAAWSNQQLQAGLNNAIASLRQRDLEIAALKQELHKQQHLQASLQKQIAALNAEIARLRKLLPPGTP